MPFRPSAEVEAIVDARHGDPFAFLGMHKARRVFTSGRSCRMPRVSRSSKARPARSPRAASASTPPDCSSPAFADRRALFRYRLRVRSGGHEQEFEDVYRFGPVLGELDLHLLVEGNHLASYQKLGAHPIVHEGVEGVAFAVWAPNAQRVSIVGDFNNWDGRRHADAPAARRRHVGHFRAGAAPGAPLQIRDHRR